MIKGPDENLGDDSAAQIVGIASGTVKILWIVMFGWYLVLIDLMTGILLCLTIVGVPLGLANFKLISVTLRPAAYQIMSIEDARALGVAPQVTVEAQPEHRS